MSRLSRLSLLRSLSLLSKLGTHRARCSNPGDDEPAEHNELAEPAEHDEDAKPAEHDEDDEPDEQAEQAEHRLSRLGLLSSLSLLGTHRARCSDGGDDEPAEHNELA